MVGHMRCSILFLNFLCFPLLLQNGTTALMLAALNGHLEVVKQLITSWANVVATDKVSQKSAIYCNVVLFGFPAV